MVQKDQKKTPLHESAIQVKLENEYTLGKVSYGLQKMEEKGWITSIKKEIKNSREAKFYFSKKLLKKKNFELISKKAERYSYWINRYSNNNITRMLGNHLHSLVKAELRAQGFEILKEKNVREYGQKRWEKTKHSLDLIAKHKHNNLTIGVEIKNMLYLTPKEEVEVKLDMCELWDIKPVFACRWLEQHRQIIESRGGFLWQFKNQIYPLGQEKFVVELQKRFGLPIEVTNELPSSSIKQFKQWVNVFENSQNNFVSGSNNQ